MFHVKHFQKLYLLPITIGGIDTWQEKEDSVTG